MDQEISYREAVEMLRDESRIRPIVPFLGAGISLASGFPAISAIVEYLAKVDFAIQHEVYAHRYPGFPDMHLSKKDVAREYQEHPSRFLRDFGWPRLGQLDADLWEWLERHLTFTKNVTSDLLLPLPQGNIKIIVDDIHERASQLGRLKLQYSDVPLIVERELRYRRQIDSKAIPNDAKRELLDLLSRDICATHFRIGSYLPRQAPNKPAEITLSTRQGMLFLELRDHLRAIAQWGLRRDLRLRETGTSKAAMREWLRWKKWYAATPGAPDAQPELLYGDWESLLDRLCEGDFDLVDSLFTSLEEGRSPTTAHRYLTFLRGAIDIPLVLTTNFDNLLERAFRESGEAPKVFDIHRDADLPDADLVRRGFSILKLHGSSYGLRLGERLRSPLEKDAQADVLRYLPDNSLIVVLGFSGSERRIMQLLQAIATANTSRENRRILWLKGPGSTSVQLRQLLHECRSTVNICEINDAGALLQDWYHSFSHGYQSSPVSYSALAGRPIPSESSGMVRSLQLNSPSLRPSLRKPVQVFSRAFDKALNPHVSSSATLAAGDFVAHLGYRYHPIWIDLESHHTVSGVVAELFDHFRTYDADSPRISIVDTADGFVSDDVLEKTVDRIGEVLGRSRYVIVFDAVESFGRTQMMHHGVPTYELLKETDPSRYDTLVKEFENRVHTLKRFLEKLLCHSVEYATPTGDTYKETRSQWEAVRFFRDSYIVLAIDKEQPRQEVEAGKTFATLDIMQAVRESLAELPSTHSQHVHGIPVDAGPLPSILDEMWYPQVDKDLARSVSYRVASVLLLKDAMASQEHFDGRKIDDAERRRVAALLGVLSVFRRPRSLPVVCSLTERWLLSDGYIRHTTKEHANSQNRLLSAHNRVRAMLEFLSGKRADFNPQTDSASQSQYVVIHQGGRIRMDRGVHKIFYECLTSELHIGTVILQWKSRYQGNERARATAVLQAMLCASLHFAAARSMYVDVFLVTHDVQAFYEYLYHRVAVLKILTVMTAMLALPLPRLGRRTQQSSVITELNDLLASVRDDIERSNSGRSAIDRSRPIIDWIVDAIGLASVVPLPSHLEQGDNLKAYTQMLREHAVQTLSLALTRSEVILRADASPDTLIGWAKQFAERERRDIDGSVFQTAADAKPNLLGDGLNGAAILKLVEMSQPAQKALGNAISSFNRIRSQSYFAKMDFLSILDEELPRGVRSPLATPQRAFLKHSTRLRARFESRFLRDSSVKFTNEQAAKWLFRCRALSHLGWNDVSIRVCSWARTGLTGLVCEQESDTRNDTLRCIRDFTELELKARLGSLCPPWWALDLEWKFSLPQGDADWIVKYDSLREIESLAVRYETLLRETSRNTDEDVRHRSSAYVLRARALYLQGRFRTAHRYLDLAACGSSSGEVDRAVGHLAIHLARAELLVYSAHAHLQFFDERLQADAKSVASGGERSTSWSSGDEDVELAKSDSKLRRAESEVTKAASVVESARHQTIWSFRMHIGMAQVRFERLLLGIEQLARREKGIEGSDFARLTGHLEQSVLSAMRHLRSALDLLPLLNDSWDKMHGSVVEKCASVQDERKIFAMWCHLYVVSRFYWGVLQMWNTGDRPYLHDPVRRLVTVDDVVTHVNGGKSGRGEVTWNMWCKALRFNRFAERDKEFDLHNWIRAAIEKHRAKADDEVRSATEAGIRAATEGRTAEASIQLTADYSVAPLRREILEICRYVSSDDNLDTMWDKRRKKPTR